MFDFRAHDVSKGSQGNRSGVLRRTPLLVNQVSGGAVPGLKASRSVPAPSPEPARMPVDALIRISFRPGGTRKGVAGLSFKAICMKSRKTGAAYWPAVAELPRVCGLL